MEIDWELVLDQLITGAAFAALFVLIFLIAKVFNDLVTPYHVDEELCKRDNVALSTSLAGYLLGTTMVFMGALLGPSQGLLMDLVVVGAYSLLGVVLLNLSHLINDRLILNRFQNVKEIIEDQNCGTGAAQFGSYIASGAIVAASVHGQGGGWATALVFFALGQLVLIVFSKLYAALTPYDLHAEIEADNVAAGVAFGGTLAALGIILAGGAAGDFVSWEYNLSHFALSAVVGVILLPLVRVLLDKVLVRGSDLNHEIHRDRNLGAGILEMTVAVAFATVLFVLV